MSKDPGFVPIPFQFVGKLLLTIGLATLLAILISYLSSWFTLPSIALLFAIAIIFLGLYLIFIVPEEPVE
ncbi:MAG: hypothetical protein PVF85_09360 [Anaerolineales bacterium]|jgi:hypothetical protein